MHKALLRTGVSVYRVLTGKGTTMVSALFFAFLVSLLLVISIYARSAQATTNSTINFQARVLTSGGSVIPDGPVSVQFKIYDAATNGSGTLEWTETQALTTRNGYITASLGTVSAFGATIDWSQQQWLTMNINGDGEMLQAGNQRMAITAVPFAFTAGQALNVASAATTAASTNSNGISVKTGNASGASSNSGSITVDTGTSSLGTTGSISIGTVSASGIQIGRVGLQTNIAGTALISGGAATFGTATQAGSLVLNDGSGGQTTTLQAGNSAGNLSFTLPTTIGAALECLQNSATPGVLQFGACGAGGGTLQNAYDNAVGGIITVTATDGAFRVRDASTTFGAASIFSVQNNAGTVDYLAIQGNGNIAVDTNTLFVDAANNRVGIGTAAPTSVLQVTNAAPTAVVTATGTAQVGIANFAAGAGGNTTIATTGTGGAGGGFAVTGGTGGQATAATTSSTGGAGGVLNITGGTGGLAAVAGTGNNIGGNGGTFTLQSGAGGSATGATSGNNTGGTGGTFTLQAGNGGTATTGTGNLVGGAGGVLNIRGGTGGIGATSGGNGGAVSLQGGTAAAMAGAAGGAATVAGTAGSATGSGGNGGALTLSAGSAGGDNTVNRTGGAIAVTAGNSRGASAGGAITVTAGTGGNNLAVGTASGGASGGITLNAGSGGTAPNATTASTGGAAGGITVNGGIGGSASVAGTGNNTGGSGGTNTWTGGTGGVANGATSGINTGGTGGAFTLQAGTGGAANTGSGNNIGGTGGALTFSGGTGGVGTTSGGNGGLVTIQGGTAAAMAGAAGGAVNIAGRAGSATGTGGAGGALTMSGGNAGGDNTVARLGGAVSITGGNAIGGAAGGAVTLTAGNGGSNLTVGTATGGNAGGITFNGGNGSTAPNATVLSTGGTAGGFTINGGTGGAAAVAGTGNNTGGSGGILNIRAGTGGAATGATSGTNTGGVGGGITILAGAGGAATTGSGSLLGGTGGGLILQAGTGGAGTVAGAGGALTLRGGTSNSAGGDIILQTSPTTVLTERLRVTNSGYVGIGTAAGTALPNSRLTVVAENVTNSQVKLRSQNAAIVATNIIGGIDFDTNDTNLTAPGVTSARIQGIATATHTAAITDTALVFSTASGTTLAERWRINATGELQGNGASILRASAGNLTLGTVTSGNVVIDGAGTLEVQDIVNLNSTQLTNFGATVNGVSVLGNFAANGTIGAANVTVDVKTAFTIAQTTAGRTLTLPTPSSNLVAGRMAYVSNIGSTSFIMHGVTITNGASQSYIYNGSVWAPANVAGGGAGVNAIGTINSQPKSADGAVISGTTLYLQTADGSNPGLISTGLQTIAGNKTFTGVTSLTSAGTALLVSNDASISGLLTSGTLNVSGLTTLSGNLVANGSATGTTGTTSGSGTNTTTLNLIADSFNVNDVVFINNSGQDYYTRITVDPTTGSYTVSPAVNYDAGATVTKYNVQNIGATSTDYTTQANRFFQGYFLGGVVIGAGSTTIGDGTISSTTTLRLQENGGAISIGGALNVTGTITGDASGLTNIDASQITGGSVSDTNLSSNVTLLGNSFNAANKLVQLDGAGALPALNGSALTSLSAGNLTGALPAISGAALTSLDAANISTGTINDLRLSTNVTTKGNSFNGINQLVLLDGSGALPTLNGSALTSLSAGNLTGALPAISGAALTSLDANSITGGTVSDARLSTNVTTAGNFFNGNNQLVMLDGAGALPALNGSALTSLSAGNLTGALPALNGSALTSLSAANLTGALPAISGAALTSLSAGNISSGTLNDLRLSTNVTKAGNAFNGTSQLVQTNASGELPALSGINLTLLNAGNISSGTINDLRLSSNVTKAGNTFNSVNGLVQLDGAGALPALNGSALTSLSAGNISSGTINDLRLSTNVTTKGNSFNGISQLVLLDGAGALPALNGSALTTLSAGNISSGTINDLRLSTNVTKAGNTFNGISQLVLLDGTGALPTLSGAALTNLSGGNISSGTVNDLRLSTNVTILGNSFNAANKLVQLDGTGALPTLNGAALTSLSGGSISSGTVADARLSANVALLGTAQSFTAQQTFAGNLIVGTDTASPTAGLISFNDATGSNGFTSVLGTNTLTASRTLNLPDVSGTLLVLAPSAVQADSTTNSSININKTGASGNILTLQKGGTTVFSVLNTGALQLQLTSASAFAVSNAGGTQQYFNIDTSSTTAGLVQIGGATADGNATLLVLDTKNSAGDPTGVNGGMYYNSVDVKNRCYEGGSWIDCTTLSLAGETTLATANGTINVTLNGNYEYLECRVDIVSRSTASIPYLRFNNNTGGTSYTWNAYGIVAAATTDWQDASDSEIQLTGTQTGTNIMSADIKITNISGSNKVVDWTSAGVEAVGTNSNRYSGVGGFYNAAQVTSIQIVASGGTFGAGSHAWCQGKNVR